MTEKRVKTATPGASGFRKHRNSSSRSNMKTPLEMYRKRLKTRGCWFRETYGRLIQAASYLYAPLHCHN
jgi:hypothetical protein